MFRENDDCPTTWGAQLHEATPNTFDINSATCPSTALRPFTFFFLFVPREVGPLPSSPHRVVGRGAARG